LDYSRLTRLCIFTGLVLPFILVLAQVFPGEGIVDAYRKGVLCGMGPLCLVVPTRIVLLEMSLLLWKLPQERLLLVERLQVSKLLQLDETFQTVLDSENRTLFFGGRDFFASSRRLIIDINFFMFSCFNCDRLQRGCWIFYEPSV
jgi:hypothetical protein